MRKSLAPAIFILGIILLSAWNGYADPGVSSIGGEYFIVGSRSCAYANGYQNFGENFSLPLTGGTTRTGHYQGHLYLNGDGTGSWETKFVQYYHQSISPGQIPMGFYDETCNVFYEELPNRFRMTVSGCIATATNGFAMGTTWATDDISLTIAASFNGDVLLLSNTRPVIEGTWQPSNPGLVIERVCSRSLTAIREFARR